MVPNPRYCGRLVPRKPKTAIIDHRSNDFRNHWWYRAVAVWILVSPLVWTTPGMPGFVYLTLLSNSAQVVMVPLLAGGLWWITASGKYIGKQYKNRWWENLVMGVLFILALWGGYGAVKTVYQMLVS